MSFQERRKSLICLAKLICQCDEQKAQVALSACEAECEKLKTRIKDLEMLLQQSEIKIVGYYSICPPGKERNELHEFLGSLRQKLYRDSTQQKK